LLGVAIAGSGYGVRVQLPAFAALPGVEVRALVGRDADRTGRIAAAHGVAVATTRFEDVLGDPRVHLVCITTPPDLHAAQAMAALGAGKHVVCEKPLATTAAVAAAMCGAAERAPGRLALVDHQLRFAPSVQRLQRLLVDGYVGTPLVVHVDVATGRELDRRQPFGWWHQRRRGGGALGAYGSHAVDLVLSILGPVDAVCGTLHTFVAERVAAGDLQAQPVDADDWGACWLRCGRARAVVQVSAVAHGGNGLGLTVHGTDGVLQLDPEGALRGRRGDGGLEDLAAPLPLPEGLRGRVPDTMWSSSFAAFAAAVTRVCAAGGDHVAGAATFSDGLAVQRVLDAVRGSATDGGWVAVETPGSHLPRPDRAP
jgi:predicted dehydrogenase